MTCDPTEWRSTTAAQPLPGIRKFGTGLACAFVVSLFSHLPAAGAHSHGGEEPPALVVFAAPDAGVGGLAHSDSVLSETGAATLESIRSDPLASGVQVGHSAPGAVLSAHALSLALPSSSGSATASSFVFSDVVVEYGDEGLASVHGRDEEAHTEVSVVIDGEDVYGWVGQGDAHYRMRPLGDGLTAVFRYDVSRLQAHGPGYLNFLRAQLQAEAPPWEPPPGAADTGETIDVMIAYTPSARRSAGNMDAWIQQALDNSERVYGNTDISAPPAPRPQARGELLREPRKHP